MSPVKLVPLIDVRCEASNTGARLPSLADRVVALPPRWPEPSIDEGT